MKKLSASLPEQSSSSADSLRCYGHLTVYEVFFGDGGHLEWGSHICEIISFQSRARGGLPLEGGSHQALQPSSLTPAPSLDQKFCHPLILWPLCSLQSIQLVSGLLSSWWRAKKGERHFLLWGSSSVGNTELAPLPEDVSSMLLWSWLTQLLTVLLWLSL